MGKCLPSIQYSSGGTRGDFLHARKIELCKPQETAFAVKYTFAELLIEAPFLNAVLSVKTSIGNDSNGIPTSIVDFAKTKLELKRPDYEPQVTESSYFMRQAVHITAEK
jgi:hypothetical protein